MLTFSSGCMIASPAGPSTTRCATSRLGEQEGQIENLHAGRQRRDPGGRKDGDLEGAGLHLLDHLRAAAKLARGEHLHLELAAGALLDQLLPLQRGLMMRAGLGLVMADLDGGLGEGSGCASKAGQKSERAVP